LGRSKAGGFTARQVIAIALGGLATLTEAGIVTVTMKGKDGDAIQWRVPEDFEERAIALDLKQGRASGVKLLSVQDLEKQLASPGATWLDRSQVSWGRGDMESISIKTSAFAKDLDTAFQQRREWLIKRGYAEVVKKVRNATPPSSAAM